jgi:malate dehydrogenase
MRPRIAVAGAGRAGSAIAARLAERDLGDVIAVDGEDRWEDAAGAAVVVLAVGDSARDGESRADLLARNAPPVREAARAVAERCPDAVVIVVTGPVDPACRVVLRETAFPRQRVVGLGATLDSARFRALVAAELGVAARDVTGLALGAHGGEHVLALTSTATVAGVPAASRLDAGRLAELAERVRGGSSDEHATAAGAVEVVEAVVLDQRRTLACAVLCQGELGIEDAVVGAPVVLGRDGVEAIVELELAPSERTTLEAAAAESRALADGV